MERVEHGSLGDRPSTQQIAGPLIREGGPRGDAIGRLRATLHDRSERGWAWYGAPDAVVVTGFAAGAVLELLAILLLADPAVASPLRLPVQRTPSIAAMFALLAVVPVLEELVLRGALFAALRARCTRPTAGALTVIASLSWRALLIHPSAWLMGGTLVTASLAAWSRVRQRALAPAIALNVGATTMVVGFSALT